MMFGKSEKEDPVAQSLIRLISCLMGWDWESLPW